MTEISGVIRALDNGIREYLDQIVIDNFKVENLGSLGRVETADRIARELEQTNDYADGDPATLQSCLLDRLNAAVSYDNLRPKTRKHDKLGKGQEEFKMRAINSYLNAEKSAKALGWVNLEYHILKRIRHFYHTRLEMATQMVYFGVYLDLTRVSCNRGEMTEGRRYLKEAIRISHQQGIHLDQSAAYKAYQGHRAG